MIYVKEGMTIVALAWILMSVVGALPFVISGEIPSFFDAFFETVSGFTTTGASILTDVESMSKGVLFQCVDLQSVTFSENTRTIEKCALAGCVNLRNLFTNAI